MGNLIKDTPYSEITATLEALDRAGIERHHFKMLRGNNQQAVATANFIMCSGTFSAHPDNVRELIEMIAGGERKISKVKLARWRPLIELYIGCMMDFYEKNAPKEVYEQDSRYYKECWQKFTEADSDEKFIDAVEYLRSSIQWK